MQKNTEQFGDVLDESHQWPCPYLFKFIVPTEHLESMKSLFPTIDFNLRESKNGKYTSVTFEVTMNSSNEVIEIYTKASSIPGIMSL